MTVTLAALPFDVFIAFAVFARIGAFFMTAPAFGDFSLPAPFRLAAALGVSGALVTVTAPLFPTWTAPTMTGIIAIEIFAGVFLGLTARAMMSALNVAGQIIAFQMGLSLAQIFDPTQDIQGAIVGGFLAILGTTLIFVTDLHHMLLLALHESYLIITPGAVPAFGDMANFMVDTLSSAFLLGARLAAPFILFGFVFYVGAGVLNRLMPQAQVFFMLLPANLAFGILLLMLTTGIIMNAFFEEFEQFLGLLVG